MTNREWALLAFKLLGLYFLASALTGIASTPYLWQTAPSEVRAGTVAVVLLPCLVAVGIGLPVWFSAEWFAARVFPAESAPTPGLGAQPVLALAASVIGLLFVAQGVPALSGSIYLFGRSLQTGVLGAEDARERLLWDASAKSNAVAGVARLLVGLALLAGPARLGAALARVRGELSSHIADEPQDRQNGPA